MNSYFNEGRSLGIYLREIGNFSVLSPEEEFNLAKRAKEGDQEALDRLTEANLRFVVNIAKEYQGRGLSLADLINEGNIGLLKAVRKFDISKGNRFLSYAVWWIRQSILVAIEENARIVRLPPNKRDLLSKIHKAELKYEEKNKRLPTRREIARMLKVSIGEIRETLDGARKQVSLDTTIREANQMEEGEAKLGDLIKESGESLPDNLVVERAMSQDVRDALGVLTPRESDIVKMFFGIDEEGRQSLGEIGNRLNLSRERVRQIKERAIAKLRRSSRAFRLRTYLN